MTTFFFSDKSTVYCIYHVYVSTLYLCDGFMFMFRLYSAAFHCFYVSFCSLTMLRVHWSVMIENFILSFFSLGDDCRFMLRLDLLIFMLLFKGSHCFYVSSFSMIPVRTL